MRAVIHTPTPSLTQSLAFYKKLGYTVLSAESPCMVTDGKAVVEINPVRFARAGVKIYGADIDATINSIGQMTRIVATESGALLTDGNGVWIYLESEPPPVIFTTDSECYGLPGNFSGLSIETTDMDRTTGIWKAIGFSTLSGDPAHGWVSCSDNEGFSVSIMAANSCPHLFFNPSFTYFNSGRNPEVIAGIRAAGIPITEEITAFNKEGLVDNIIIRDPGGYGFFIFND